MGRADFYGVSFSHAEISFADALPMILRDIPSIVLRATDACGNGTAAFITDCRKRDQIVWVSSAFEHVTQFRAEELLGRTEEVLEGPLTVRRIEKLCDSPSSQERVVVEVLHYRSDGSLFINQLEVFLLGEHLILFKQLAIKSLENHVQSSMDSWTVIEVGVWLKKRHFSTMIINYFFDHNTAGKDLVALTHDELAGIGITSLFDQDRLLNFVAIESSFRAQCN